MKSRDERPEGSHLYDREQIDHLICEAREHDAAWRSWFAANGIEPLEVRYEELAADPSGVAKRVVALLGLAAATIAPQTERQADELNAQWAERYRAELVTKTAREPT